MGRERDDQNMERLLHERGQHLMRAAVALTGSRADAEDLLQAALERLVQNWRRIDTDPEGYLRRTLYNLAADGWRRRSRWRGRLAEFRAQARTADTGREDVAVVDLRDQLARLLQQLPPRQRAVVVLRYWEQRTEAETRAARLLQGTVKSAAARGLRRCGNWPDHREAGKRTREGYENRNENRNHSDRRKIMNGALEDLLREGLRRYRGGEGSGRVVGKARARLRLRKIAVRAALVGGTAAVTATAVVAATGTGQGAPELIRARTTADVISHVENALAATNEVVQAKTVFSAPFPPVTAWTYRSDVRFTESGFIPPAMTAGMPGRKDG